MHKIYISLEDADLFGRLLDIATEYNAQHPYRIRHYSMVDLVRIWVREQWAADYEFGPTVDRLVFTDSRRATEFVLRYA